MLAANHIKCPHSHAREQRYWFRPVLTKQTTIKMFIQLQIESSVYYSVICWILNESCNEKLILVQDSSSSKFPILFPRSDDFFPAKARPCCLVGGWVKSQQTLSSIRILVANRKPSCRVITTAQDQNHLVRVSPSGNTGSVMGGNWNTSKHFLLTRTVWQIPYRWGFTSNIVLAGWTILIWRQLKAEIVE